MYIPSSLVCLLGVTTAARAFQLSDVKTFTRDLNFPSISEVRRSILDTLKPRDSCPSVWYNISKDLTSEFLSAGQCTDDARAAIRAAFHDCFSGGCDGSLVLADECNNDPANNGMQGWCGKVGSMAKDKNVGVADLIQFAGAHAIKTCPLGPTIPAYVGRKDSSTAATAGQLPTANESGDDLLSMFQAKGFSATDLAALVGAHSTAKQFVTDASKAGASMDSTPGTWDVNFYEETISGTAPFTLRSDKNLADHDVVGAPFKSFVSNQGGWNAAFTSAMGKMSLLGVDGGASSLTDCTDALPGGTAKRDVKAAPINGRVL